jgi:hypothetical protein
MSALNQPYGDPRAAREGAELALRMQRVASADGTQTRRGECEEAEQRGAAV